MNSQTFQPEIDHFYDLLARRIAVISSRFGARLPTALDLPLQKSAWLTKGVYFIFEEGEHRVVNEKPRVVRVGSHTGPASTIESRIVGEHAVDWGRSVFRRHIGTALIRRGTLNGMKETADCERWAQHWYSSVNRWAVHIDPKRLHPTLHPLHKLITDTIGRMS